MTGLPARSAEALQAARETCTAYESTKSREMLRSSVWSQESAGEAGFFAF